MQILINGIISGSAIALLAVAFQAVYLPTRVFFVGLAGIYAVTPFIAHACRAQGWAWPLAIASSILAAVALSLFLEWSNHARLARKKAGDSVHLIASLGTYIVIVQIVAMVWGLAPKTLRSGIDTVTRHGDVVVTGAQWTTLGVAIGLLGGFAAFLNRSRLGLRLRAMSDNVAQFALFGYDVSAYRYLGFAIAGLFCAAASLVTAYDVGFDPYTGLQAVLLAIVAVIIGGQGSFLGPVIGAFMLGVIRAEVVWHFSPRWQAAVTFGLLALFLLFRPQGILGRSNRLEEST